MKTREVVITGVGIVSSVGAGRDALCAALAEGRPVLREIDRSAGFHAPHAATRAALVAPEALSPWLAAGAARRMSPPSRFAVAAARAALADAGLEATPAAHERTACVLASTFGPTSFTEKLLRQILIEGPEAASPALFTECVANAPAAQVALAIGARGPNVTITQRETGPLAAVARAAELIRRGRATCALAGTAEEISPLLHAVLDRFRALARPSDPCGERALPFDRRRRGALAAEGATLLLLEDAEAAVARGARPLARVIGFARAFDPAAPPYGWGRAAEPLARTLAGDLARAHALDRVDAIVSGASGARRADRLEALMLRAAWSDPATSAASLAGLPPVLAPKAITGEFAGGQLATAVMIAADRATLAVPRAFEKDDELGVVPVGRARGAGPARVLVTALAAGGGAAWLVLGGA